MTSGALNRRRHFTSTAPLSRRCNSHAHCCFPATGGAAANSRRLALALPLGPVAAPFHSPTPTRRRPFTPFAPPVAGRTSRITPAMAGGGLPDTAARERADVGDVLTAVRGLGRQAERRP